MSGNATLSAEEHGELTSTPGMNADQAVGRRARQILVVDRDLGFVLWFAVALVEAGYAAFPAASLPGARELAGRLEPNLDVLVVNPRMAGASGLVSCLKGIQPELKVAALVDAESPPIGSLTFANATIPKPVRVDRKAARCLVHAIDHLLTLNRAA